MNYILSIFGSELRSVTQAAAVLALSGIFADILSLFRDRLLAADFGASRALDIYYASFRIPDLIYTVSLFFAASTALIPAILEKFSENNKEAEKFFGNIFSLFFVGTVLMVIAAYFSMPLLMPYFTPGFSSEEQGLAINLSRILLLSPLLLGLSNLASSVVQSFRRFYVYALSPLFYNLGIIIGILFLMPRFGLYGIVWGVILGAFLHLVIQLPTVFSLGFSITPRFPKISRDVIDSLKLSFPRTLGLSLNQIVLSVITAMASTLGAGAVSVFNFAANLQSVPLSIIGLSYSVAAFPTLAALFLLSLSILSQGLLMLYIRAFYASGHTYLPVIMNFLSSIVSVASAWWLLSLFKNSLVFRNLFLSWLRVGDISEGGVLVLPLALSLGSAVNLFLLAWYFRKIFEICDISLKIRRSLRDSIVSSAVLGVVVYFSLKIFALFFNLDTFIGIFTQGFLAGILGIVSGAIILAFLKNQEFSEFYDAFRDRFWKKLFVVASEPEKLP